MARCLLIDSNLPNTFWAEAVNTANYIRNRLPTKSLNGKTPYEAWTGKIPDISHLKIFGSRVIYLDREPGKGKLDRRGYEGIFLGFPEESKAFRIWSPDRRKVIISRDVKFTRSAKFDAQCGTIAKSPGESNRETHREFFDREPLDSPNVNEQRDHETSSDTEDKFFDFDEVPGPQVIPAPSADEKLPAAPPKQGQMPADKGKNQKPKQPRSGTREGLRSSTKSQNKKNDSSRLPETSEEIFLAEVPMKDAMSGSDVNEWNDAMANEMASIIKNETWVMVDRPREGKIIGSRMTLRNKLGPDGSIERRKARLVAQGFSQQPGVHFTETFAPVARFSSIHLMACLAAQNNLKIKQFDVATAYLNGVLEEEILMEPPKFFAKILQHVIDSGGDRNIGIKAKEMLQNFQRGDKVCLLKKSLYGLKQAGRSWHLKLTSALRKLNATPTKSDPCLFQIGSGEAIVLIAIYVDDILIAARREEKINELKTKLAHDFEIKDLGPVSHCLGVEFAQTEDQVTMCQRGYIREILEKFDMSDCKSVITPIDAGIKLTKNEEQSPEDLRLPYRELIGALTYLSTITRPDIAFAVSSLGQFNNAYGSEHWKAAKRVLRYLKGTSDVGLTFRAEKGPIQGYVDADWGSCIVDRRSFSGYIFLLGGSPISWDSKKQRTVALSTTEAEYMAISECIKEAIYLQRFIRELGFNSLANLSIFSDNQSSLSLIENPIFHARTKHIDIRHHFIRDVLKSKPFAIKYTPTEEQVADFLTKGLPRVKHSRCMNAAGLSAITY